MKRYFLPSLLLLASCGTGIDYNSGSSSREENTGSKNVVQIDNSGGASSSDIDPCADVLWKPVSESDGKLVVLAPLPKWNSFTVYDATTDEPEFCSYDGVFTDGRQTWRCSQVGGDYTGEFEIETDAAFCSDEVTNPSERND